MSVAKKKSACRYVISTRKREVAWMAAEDVREGDQSRVRGAVVREREREEWGARREDEVGDGG